jgi:hypothetical protein
MGECTLRRTLGEASMMRKFVFLLALVCAPIFGLANSERQIAIAREFTTETAPKGFCIANWSKPERSAALSKFASISEMCACVQREMQFLVSDDLAITFLEARLGMQEGDPGKYISADAAEKAVTDFWNLYVGADRACCEKFIRRRDGR